MSDLFTPNGCVFIGIFVISSSTILFMPKVSVAIFGKPLFFKEGRLQTPVFSGRPSNKAKHAALHPTDCALRVTSSGAAH
jgi:hypothetical protein